MGDNFTLKIRCGKCHKFNDDVYYAESSEATTFVCEHCKSKNRIVMTFTAVVEDGKKIKEK